MAQAARELDVHENVLRQAFPGHGQIKPEQLEIDQLKREVAMPTASLNNFPSSGPRQ